MGEDFEDEAEEEVEVKVKPKGFPLASWLLLFLLTIGLVFFFWAFLNMDKEGLACQHQPFKWGADKVVGNDVGGLYCSCMTEFGGDFQTNYGGFNPYDTGNDFNLSFS